MEGGSKGDSGGLGSNIVIACSILIDRPAE